MKKKLAIVGGGTTGLFLAAFLNGDIYDVTIYEKKPSLGRKFLVAGDGGFNLTHGEDLAQFKNRYSPTRLFEGLLQHFNNNDLRDWLQTLGIPTFVGTSGKVFPEKGIKPIQVLKAIKTFLVEKNVNFEFNKTFSGWDADNQLIFNSEEKVKADLIVFALGGASWKVTGSDGSWINVFSQKGIATLPFRSSNCGFRIVWSKEFIEKYEGQPLKNMSISYGGQTQKGELVITKFGLEGNAVYGLSHLIQAALKKEKKVVVHADLKPTMDLNSIISKMESSDSKISDTLRDVLKLPKALVDLIKLTLTKDEFLDIPSLASYIKSFPLKLVDAAPLDEAISTLGGICLSSVDSNFELKTLKNNYCLGEMLDWNAPTGGYLIQGCASMGVYLANHLNKK